MSSDDHELAATLAVEAGELLVDLRKRARLGYRLGDEGDARSNHLLLARLGEERPDDIVLSEEAHDDPRRTAASRVWIVDPLDGTREYREGRSDWAVHVALWERHRGLIAGAVALPDFGWVGTTAVSPLPNGSARSHAHRNGRRVRVVSSRTRATGESMIVARALGGEIVPMGSAGAKAMAVVRGEADVYVHASGMYEWDAAAPTVVAAAHGLHVSGIDGRELQFNKRAPWSDDFLICHPDLAEQALSVLDDIW